MSRWWQRRRRDQGPSGAEPATGLVETITEENFLESTSGRLTAVDFWAPWCGPCRAFAPVFAAEADRFSGRVAFAKCNLDDNGPLAALLQIQSIPTVVLFGPDGSELNRISGFLSRAQLDRLVTGALERTGS